MYLYIYVLYIVHHSFYVQFVVYDPAVGVERDTGENRCVCTRPIPATITPTGILYRPSSPHGVVPECWQPRYGHRVIP